VLNVKPLFFTLAENRKIGFIYIVVPLRMAINFHALAQISMCGRKLMVAIPMLCVWAQNCHALIGSPEHWKKSFYYFC